MKVALVHDYLREYGGAERVLEALHEIFPDAPVYTTYFNKGKMGNLGDKFKGWDIRTSWIQYLPFANRLISPLRIFAPFIFESFDLSDYDLVISSCNVYFSKAVKTDPKTLHISYIHTPPRYLYGYATSYNYKKHWWSRIGGEIMNHFLRIVDFEVSQRPNILVANSKNVAERIKKFYRRESVVIYPPVILPVIPAKAGIHTNIKSHGSRIKSGMTNKDGYFLTVGRLVRGKGVDVIMEAAIKMGILLKVVGTGPELKKYEVSSIKYKDIQFLGAVSDEELARLYAGAKALILASEDEDFGITAVEAQAVGTPVIAPASGGFLESVADGKTGILYGGPGRASVDSLTQGITRFNGLNDLNHLNKEDLIKNARKFSKERFKKEILELVKANLHT